MKIYSELTEEIADFFEDILEFYTPKQRRIKFKPREIKVYGVLPMDSLVPRYSLILFRLLP